jgi:protocatechuate 3,4-dioxygenase beta subunit
VRRNHVGLLVAAAALVLAGAVPARAATTTGLPPVTHLTAAGRGSTSIALNWSDPGARSVTVSVVRFAVGTHAPASSRSGTAGGTVAEPAHAITVGRLRAGVRYTFAVFAADGHGHYAKAATVGATTGPAAMTGVRAFEASGGVTLTWTNPTTASFSGVIVRYARSATAPATPTSGNGAAPSSAKATTVQLPALTPGAQYSVSLWAFDASHRYSTAATTRFSTQPAPATAGTVSGTVSEDAAHRLAGVTVSAADFDTGRGYSTVTDPEGHYTLSTAPGDYEISFSGDEITGGDADATGYVPGYDDVHVTSGAGRHLDETLSVGGAITGVVTDGAGAPLAHVVPYLAPIQPYVESDSSISFAFFSSSTGAAGTAADGSFTIKGVPSDAVHVCYDPTVDDVTGGSTGTGYATRCEHTAVAVAPRSTVVLDPALLVSTDRTGGAISGTVTDSAGHPAVGAIVEAGSDDPQAGGFWSAVTGPDGTYRVNGLPAGGYELCVDPTPVDPAPSEAGDALNCRPTPVAVQVGTTTSADVSLTAGAGVAGIVTAPGGVPVENALVVVSPAGSDQGYSALTDRSGRYQVGHLPAGSYTVCFDSGSATVPGGATGVSSGCHRGRVSVRTGAFRIGVDGQLTTAGAIRGTVTDADGHPAANVDVDVERIDGGDDGGFSTSDGQGRFTVTGLGAGQWQVCFSQFELDYVGQLPCYGGPDPDSARPVTVSIGRTTSLPTVALPPAGSITVAVHDTDGHPLSGVNAAVLAACPDDCGTVPLFGSRPTEVLGSDITGADGTVSFAGLRPGKYAVCLFAFYAATPTGQSPTGYADSCTASTYTVTVTKAHTTTVTRVLAPAGAVSGTVTGTDGHPVAGVEVAITHSSATDYLDPDAFDFGDPFTSGPQADAVTDADGRYTIRGVQAGAQTVCFQAEDAVGPAVGGYLDQCLGGAPGSTEGGSPVTVTAGARTPGHDVALTRGAGIRGRVGDRTAAHAPVSGVEVMVFDGGGRAVTAAETDSTGRYVLTRLPAGSYRVCFAGRATLGQCYAGVSWFGDPAHLPADATPVVLSSGAIVDGIDAHLVVF